MTYADTTDSSRVMHERVQSHGPSATDLAHWIDLSGESDFVEAKGPMLWDGADASASLAKDMAAFSNSRDGGVIVVGKAEAEDGSYSAMGLSADEAASFDTTTVGQWVNARFSPPIRLACYHAESKGRVFVVIVVQEFDDIPTLCIKGFQETNNPKCHILREGTIYVRNQNAESKPIRSVDELRSLLGLATRKRGDELLAHLEAMLRGRSLTELQPISDPFAEEVQQVQRELMFNPNTGGWYMSFHPEQHIGDRWNTPEELERLISHYSARVYDEFPGHRKGTFTMGWGIANDLYGETWALTKSGLFCVWKEFRENHETAQETGYRGGDEARHPVPPGEWIEYTWAIRTAVEFFMFLSRFVDAYGADMGVRIKVSVGPLGGRKLVSLGRVEMGYGAPQPCRAPYYSFDKTTDGVTLRADWESICADVLKGFFELFPDHRIAKKTLLDWVEKSKARRA